MSLFISLAVAALLGLIPANIAKNKGRSFGLWWFYGWMLFIVALPHALLMQDLGGAAQNYTPQVSFGDTDNSVNNHTANSSSPINPSGDAFDNIIKYKELLDVGVITQEEFDAKRKDLLGM